MGSGCFSLRYTKLYNNNKGAGFFSNECSPPKGPDSGWKFAVTKQFHFNNQNFSSLQYGSLAFNYRAETRKSACMNARGIPYGRTTVLVLSGRAEVEGGGGYPDMVLLAGGRERNGERYPCPGQGEGGKMGVRGGYFVVVKADLENI